ncbi:MAG: hypothetical protein ACI8WB_001076 [Phenylobacterium sp.]|jgi:hypothetical protein
MKLLNRMANSINSKLFVPLLMVFFIAIGLLFIVMQYRTGDLVQQRLHNRAFELAESFAVATEVNSGQSNFIRVVNSIGAYDDIDQLFLLDDANETIVAASKNRYNNASIAELDEPLLASLLSHAMTAKSNRFMVLDNDQDVFIYKMQMIAENRQTLRSMTLLSKLITPVAWRISIASISIFSAP